MSDCWEQPGDTHLKIVDTSGPSLLSLSVQDSLILSSNRPYHTGVSVSRLIYCSFLVYAAAEYKTQVIF